MQPLCIEIATDWLGGPVETAERVAIDLRSMPESFEIRIDAPFHADPPPPGPPGTTEGLWEYEVVEVFLWAPPTRYLELEFSPHGHSLALQLDGVRQPVSQVTTVRYQASIEGERWRGVAWIPWSEIPEAATRINAYAIHGVAEGRRYLAWQPVPGDAPDFHRLEAFAELAAPLRPAGDESR